MTWLPGAFGRRRRMSLKEVEHTWIESRADGVFLSASQEESLGEIRRLREVDGVQPRALAIR